MNSKYMQAIIKDAIFRLLFINMFLVVLGYAAAYSIGPWFIPFFSVFKQVLVFVSLVYVIKLNGFSTIYLLNKFNIYLLICVMMGLSFFSNEPFQSVYKGLTFIFPLLYIIYSVNYLLQYGAYNLLVSLSLMILIVYAFVPFSFLFFGFDIQKTNIYGYEEGRFFVSNNYGWSSTLFLLSSITVLRFYPLKRIYRLFILIFIPFVFYVLLISGNRAGLLSAGLAFIFLLFKDKIFSFMFKFTLVLLLFIAVALLSLKENSAISTIERRNEVQIESGNEGRLIGTNAMLKSFDNNPVYWFTGVGMFNYTELHKYGGILPVYHNSYWEVLFGAGIFVFIIFLKIMIYDPFRVFWNNISNYSLLAIPLIIIPFFESNLTGGQFLFFPWFSYIILLNSKEFRLYNIIKNGHEVQTYKKLVNEEIVIHNS
ncbi:hypothetical protein EGM88_14415 [Aureibaculum marinum]|uniref:O-antigen ligase domain-containing protein n=1 Tax=Aureibaculum marinum TaxID=2487930 RepID=A0A3N4N9J1_9FLAO|nr:O-antigen polymerase [Aureibaculum marinum]RPD91728.1 hypothetical protein EGM88_14415 [Aureibaculum marinum]